MQKSPAVLFYTGDFMVGTMFMNNEQVGKYIRLLCMQHQQGHLSKKQFLTICNENDQEIFNKFEIDKQGNYFNVRMDLETKKRDNYSQSRKENALNGLKNKVKHDEAYAKHMGNDNDNDNSNISIREYYKNNDELNDIFNDFLELRKKLKAQNTDRAVKLLLNTLEEFDDDIKIKMIEQSITNSWKGLFELKKKKGMSSSDIDKLG